MFRREIVSESRVHSDSIDPKKRNRVRIKGIFGQHWHEKSGIVSESRAYSDNIGTKKWNRVRIRGIFGQHWHEKVESCPNQGYIQTALTRKSEIVSESRAYSDSIGTKKWNRVRIKGIFGQHWHEKVESCPNQGNIRTALMLKSGIVSESGAH
jgi:hypothetical protein